MCEGVVATQIPPFQSGAHTARKRQDMITRSPKNDVIWNDLDLHVTIGSH